MLLGDGELNEGQVWEGMMFGAHHRLVNLVVWIRNMLTQFKEVQMIVLTNVTNGKGSSFIEENPSWDSIET